MRWIVVICTLFCCTIACSEPPAPTVQAPPTTEPTATATAAIGIALATKARPTQAIVQVTPTPLPTATPTPLPTPIVYAVADGDTVWSIAYSNGTNPDALLALNPNVRPELLSIGDTLILPPRPTPLAQTVAGTAVPLAVQVLSLQIYRSPTGGAWLLGEVENQGSFAAENVQLEISMSSEDGQSLGRLTTWLASPLVLAGERAPFGLQLRDFSAEPASIEASVVAGSSVAGLGNRNVGLVVDSAEFEATDQQVTATGIISNSSNMTATAAIIATFYDAAGNVSGFAQTTITTPLAPAQAADYRIVAAAPGLAIVDQRITVIGLNLSESAQN